MIVQKMATGTTNSEECIDAIFSRTLLLPPKVQEHEIRILQSKLGDGENCMKVAIWGNQRVIMRRFAPGGRSEADLKEVCHSVVAPDVWNGVSNMGW